MLSPNEEEVERGGKGEARQVLTPEPSCHSIPSAYVHRGLSWFVRCLPTQPRSLSITARNLIYLEADQKKLTRLLTKEKCSFAAKVAHVQSTGKVDVVYDIAGSVGKGIDTKEHD